MSNAHTRSQARRNTLLAQGAALLLAGVAIAAIAVGLPGLSAPAAGVQTVSDLLAEREAERERLESAEVVEDGEPTRAVNLQSVAERLELIHQAQAAEPVTDVVAGGEIPNTDGEEKIEVKYLGHIAEPSRQLALISLNGRQRIIPIGATTTFTPEGGEVVSLHIVGVSTNELVYELDGERQRIDKAPRMAGAVTKIETNEQPRGGPPGVDPAEVQGLGEESDMDRRRREAMERRQRILDDQEERNRRGGGRDDDEDEN